ncbi:MAG: 30S ribosome-binding factor RbfA [Acidimicrobiales bacterium]
MSRRPNQRGRGSSGGGARRKSRPATNRQYPRTARLNALIHEIVADELGRADDDRLGLLTVTGVEVDAELDRAQVFLSTLDSDPDADPDADDELLEILAEEYRKPLQAAIARSARLRKTPEVVFAFDPAIRSGARIDEILAGLDTGADPDPDRTGPGDPEPGPGEDGSRPGGAPAGADDR